MDVNGNLKLFGDWIYNFHLSDDKINIHLELHPQSYLGTRKAWPLLNEASKQQPILATVILVLMIYYLYAIAAVYINNLNWFLYIHIQSWSELLAPLVNMIKEGSENKPALLILLIFYLK